MKTLVKDRVFYMRRRGFNKIFSTESGYIMYNCKRHLKHFLKSSDVHKSLPIISTRTRTVSKMVEPTAISYNNLSVENFGYEFYC